MSVRLDDGVVHSFFGGAQRHNTAVTVAVVDGRVTLHGEVFRCVAWGEGVTAKRRSARLREKRRAEQKDARGRGRGRGSRNRGSRR